MADVEVTECVLWRTGYEETSTIGVVRHYSGDSPNRKIARMRALENVLRTSGLGRDQRRIVWMAYHGRTQQQHAPSDTERMRESIARLSRALLLSCDRLSTVVKFGDPGEAHYPAGAREWAAYFLSLEVPEGLERDLCALYRQFIS